MFQAMVDGHHDHDKKAQMTSTQSHEASRASRKAASITGASTLRKAIIALSALTLAGASLSSCSLPAATTSQSEANTAPSDAPPSTSQSGSGDERATPIPKAPAPSREKLMAATLEVPPVCEEFGLRTEATATFVNGVAKSPVDNHAKITLSDVVQTEFDGTPVALALFTCDGGGAYAYNSLGVYDSDMKLVGRLEPWGENPDAPGYRMFTGEIHDFTMTNLSARGNTLTFQVPAIKALGDQTFHAAPSSYAANATLEWKDGQFVERSIVYDTPDGRKVVPDRQVMQIFYDAISSGKEASIRDMADPKVIEFLDQPFADPNNPQTVRQSLYPAGATVDSCVLYPGGNDTGFVAPRNRPGVAIEVGWVQSSAQPGDFLCGITPGEQQRGALKPWDKGYQAWFVVNSPADGKPFVRQQVFLIR
ncbi:hypothetical protein I6B53_00645 [Schaalia sp. 19OD2882]|uniref:alanine and proline-rich secreted protein Apa n=1 Tax=Schaalia sp. 19OD2882 TaxID=2794089 RepID=UPI001C1EBAEA|nr:alanine and proline-rich secreted protein Apa [Schaalia sp. 19OD2882]QWW19686.1 hypothetical protein I6B53_00645 [Schaalia sp. 19OD2882]